MGRRIRRALVACCLLLATASLAAAQGPASGDGLISLDVRDADVRDLLNALASNHGLNIVYGPQTEAAISIHLEKISLSSAIDAIVGAAGLSAFRRDGILYVLRSSDKEAAHFDTRVFQVQYADMLQLQDLIKVCLGEKGKITGYDLGRTLVVWDEPSRLDMVAELVRAADQMPRQVLIEAKILEVSLTENLKFGVNWSEMLNQGQLAGRADQSGFAANHTPGREGFFATLRHGELHFVLEALEQRTTVKTLANPKVLALDNRKAEIIIGGKIGYPVLTSTTTATMQSINFLEVGTQLKLTPHITDDGSVLMEVHPEVSDGVVVDGLPSETTTQATTTVLVRDGETLLIGGLIREKISKERRAIPLLGRVPFLGWFFGKTVDVVDKGELVVFVTPHLVKPDSAASEVH